MKNLIFLFLFFASTSCFSQVTFKYLFSKLPADIALINQRNPWVAGFSAQVSGIKVTESLRENAKVDATILASAGGSLNINKYIQKDGKQYSRVSISPLVLLLNGDTGRENQVLDISYAASVGFLNNTVQIGYGWDLGEVPLERNRGFLLISLGVNLQRQENQ